MKRRFILLSLLLLAAAKAHADNPGPYIPTPLGCAALPSFVTAQPLMAPFPGGTKYVDFNTTGGTLNYRDDGVLPTSSNGIALPAGNWTAAINNLTRMQLINASGTVTGWACAHQ